MRVAPGLLLALGLALAPGALGATVHVATVAGGINPAVADYLGKAIERSEREGAVALVIELDTPGGLLASTKTIVNDILNAEVPVIVFVSPRGAWAASAGTFITLAAHVAAMAPGTSIGAAHPVSFVPSAPPQPQEPTPEGEEKSARRAPRDVSGEKIENFTAAFIESIAEARNRNVKWAVEAVRNSVAIPQSEALEKNVIDLVAEDLGHLLERVDGREVTVGREKRVIETASATVVRISMDLVNRIFNVLGDPQIALLLILAGLLGLYVEFTQPGMVFPGVAGAICLVLAGLALQIIPFNWIGLILILSGLGLLVAEIFVTSFGVLFTSGLICLAAGAYLLFDVPEESDLIVPFWRIIFPAVLGVAIFGGLIVIGLSRSVFRPQFAGAEELVSSVGVAETPLRPRGRVRIRSELWTGEADENLPRGTRVRVVGLDGLVVRVTRERDGTEETR
ncbi:MAG: nodulation protein NfeD [Myxococcota bacterium]